uniref:F-box domain-containing protein n=1 Tax=Leersia perrieri TaxID=77586 RepID=A0A0D9X7C8_9ORYZ
MDQDIDWRSDLGQDIRNMTTNYILRNLQMKLETANSTALIDLQKVAARIESRIHTIAADYGDYLRRINLVKKDMEDSHPILWSTFLYIRQQGKTIQADRNVHGRSFSSMLYSQVLLNERKKPSYPCGEDRISELPHDLIHHIMSLLSIREAVRTSVLSRWWVNKWTGLQNIKLDIHSFRLDREKFRNFVDKLLLHLHKVNSIMHTFQLDSFALDCANCWINHAIEHKAKVLKFAEYEQWEPFYLDPKFVGFSSQFLKTLELTNAALDQTVFDPLNSTCPALENLDQRIRSSWYKNSYRILATVTLIDASNVRCMELSAIDRQFTFVEQNGSGPMFRNLRSLRMGTWCTADLFSPLRRYVQFSPMLESVLLKLSTMDRRYELTSDQLAALVDISHAGAIYIHFE